MTMGRWRAVAASERDAIAPAPIHWARDGQRLGLDCATPCQQRNKIDPLASE